MLPLPRAGDTAETFVVREGLCLAPVIRWICRGTDLAMPFDALQKQKDNLQSSLALLSSLMATLVSKQVLFDASRRESAAKKERRSRWRQLPRHRQRLTSTARRSCSVAQRLMPAM